VTRDDLLRWHREWEAELASGRVRMWAAFLVERMNAELDRVAGQVRAEQHDMIMRCAERIHCAHEVIGKNAEKKGATHAGPEATDDRTARDGGQN